MGPNNTKTLAKPRQDTTTPKQASKLVNGLGFYYFRYFGYCFRHSALSLCAPFSLLCALWSSGHIFDMVGLVSAKTFRYFVPCLIFCILNFIFAILNLMFITLWLLFSLFQALVSIGISVGHYFRYFGSYFHLLAACSKELAISRLSSFSFKLTLIIFMNLLFAKHCWLTNANAQ